MTFEQQAQTRHNGFGPVGEISQCAVLNLALPAEGLAQENTRGRVTVGDRFDIHGYQKNKIKIHIYMATYLCQKTRESSIEAIQRTIAQSKFRLGSDGPILEELGAQ